MQLRSWQQSFVDRYLSSDAQKSLLVAMSGTGKTITALSAAKKKIENGDASGVVIVSDRKVLQYQWANVARQIGMEAGVGAAIGQLAVSLTYQSIIRKKKSSKIL